MNKHFIVPEGDVLISFSGGRTSGFMLHQILEANNGLPDKAKVVFANTGREMPETLDFVQECSERWSVPITWLEYTRKNNRVNFNVVNHNSASRNGEPFKRLIYKPYLPNIARRFCTEQLKVKTIKRFLVAKGWKRWANTVGIRADENRRIKQSKDNRWFNWYPLNDAKLSKLNVMNFWNKQSFDLKIMRGAGNCDGCFLKSEATLAAMFRLHPDRMQWWVEMENQVNASFHKSRTYSGLQSFVQQQQDWIFDDENFLCQADDGECTD
jgi:3'-phosphoadenosine 5'-phosphosulfate sulfotransferase (PAPS reductase)/FAD synthetase